MKKAANKKILSPSNRTSQRSLMDANSAAAQMAVPAIWLDWPVLVVARGVLGSPAVQVLF